ncbi:MULTISPECIES: recombinase family protein [Luteibacter]|uniref:recombinase family protein n=1 Tax=Luteibacter TaxID=242605 RepID=UPI00068ADC77|nr:MULTISPECIES: recombinase family protein [unclassified Luteibacter]
MPVFIRPRTASTAQPVIVAAYMRMSTDMQRYSLENQTRAIDAYAAGHGMNIVRVYQDAGRSGLTIERRPGLTSLMDDVRGGRAGFDGVLVLDVTRWGRFQNTDEAAFHEFMCWRSGIQVIYVGEPFENDQSPFSMVFKGLKRAMAAEYSRELSAKTSAGQRHLASLGYRQGAIAGYGLRRLLVSADGEAKFLLGDGDHKSILTDRIILVPGPPEEVKTVRWMFQRYLEGLGCSAIARELNDRGVPTHRGKPWVYGTVRTILDGEKYVGHAVYCRASKKLAGPLVQNPESDWVRKEGAYEAVIAPELFRAVAARRVALRKRDTRTELLDQARRLLKREGRLSAPLLDAEPGILSSHGFARRFGGLTALYREVGFVPGRNPRYADIRLWLTRWRESLTAFAVGQLEEAGSTVTREGWCLTVDDAWSLSFMVVHGARPRESRQQWFNHRKPEDTDVVVFARSEFGEPGPKDYFVLPRVMFPTWPSCIYTRNGPLLESCRYPSLAVLEDLARLSRQDTQLCG